jgi:dTDP-4-dehydrorhamnose 3,5-epimerase
MATQWTEISDFLASEIKGLPGVSATLLPVHRDQRGCLFELWREDEIPAEFMPRMACASWSLPEAQRGPHEHMEQDDYFIFAGPSDFQIALWDARPEAGGASRGWILTGGETRPIQLHVPRGVVHGYRNIGREAGLVVTVASSLFQGLGRKEAVDEIRHEQDPRTPYQFPNL